MSLNFYPIQSFLVFSFYNFVALNNLKDISESGPYVALVGFTEEEIKANSLIKVFLEAIADQWTIKTGKAMASDNVFQSLISFYNGYNFSLNSEQKVINPFSFLSYLRKLKKKGYDVMKMEI